MKKNKWIAILSILLLFCLYILQAEWLFGYKSHEVYVVIDYKVEASNPLSCIKFEKQRKCYLSSDANACNTSKQEIK